MKEWYLVNPIEIKNFNKLEKLDNIILDYDKKQQEYISLLLDGKEVK